MINQTDLLRIADDLDNAVALLLRATAAYPAAVDAVVRPCANTDRSGSGDERATSPRVRS